MDNLKITIDERGGTITIVADLQEPTLSRSGKSLVFLSTGGPVKTNELFQGKPVVISLGGWVRSDREVR